MGKINLGRKLDFGRPIDLGDALYEQSLKNVQLVQKVILSGRQKTPAVTTRPLRKKIDLGKEIDLGKKLDFGRGLDL
jgi:hypothetical protein